MHASHQFINDYFEQKELLGSFEIDTSESLFESCKVTAEYVALQIKYYGARLTKASYDAKLAYDESGNPLFVTENNELVDGIWTSFRIRVLCLDTAYIKDIANIDISCLIAYIILY